MTRAAGLCAALLLCCAAAAAAERAPDVVSNGYIRDPSAAGTAGVAARCYSDFSLLEPDEWHPAEEWTRGNAKERTPGYRPGEYVYYESETTRMCDEEFLGPVRFSDEFVTKGAYANVAELRYGNTWFVRAADNAATRCTVNNAPFQKWCEHSNYTETDCLFRCIAGVFREFTQCDGYIRCKFSQLVQAAN